jgi:predicted nucleotide-binding protein
MKGLVVDKTELAKELKNQISEGYTFYNQRINKTTELQKTKKFAKIWDDHNIELLKQSFDSTIEFEKYIGVVPNKLSGEIAIITALIVATQSLPSEVAAFKKAMKAKLEYLQLLNYEVGKNSFPSKRKLPKLEKDSHMNIESSIFIVHGHDRDVKNSVALMLERLNLKPIILHEQINAGMTIIEKFELFSNVKFAIVLLTDDDLGKSKIDKTLTPRARQNVILELGYFLGKLGRDKVCTLYKKGVELPNDLSGVLYLELDTNERWKYDLAKELKHAGYFIDLNKLI